MFVQPGWGARLKEERRRAGLKQEELAHRNTQRAYEQEKTAPDVRYLADLQGRGLDVRYIVTADRIDGESGGLDPVVERCWHRLSTENRAALRQLIESLAGASLPSKDDRRPTLHDPTSGYRAGKDDA